jgi:VIT1/CCC1 family predicted Fe2+/Mn2+ transporter
MRRSLRAGFSFGLTSGVITTLGLMVGLHSGTHSVLAVTGGIITISIADAFSDALGIHLSEESKGTHSVQEIWETTVATFFAKALFALSFLVPVLLLDLATAIAVAVVWGLSLVCLLSYKLATDQGEQPLKVIGEHLLIALLVIVTTHYLGDWVAKTFA